MSDPIVRRWQEVAEVEERPPTPLQRIKLALEEVLAAEPSLRRFELDVTVQMQRGRVAVVTYQLINRDADPDGPRTDPAPLEPPPRRRRSARAPRRRTRKKGRR